MKIVVLTRGTNREAFGVRQPEIVIDPTCGRVIRTTNITASGLENPANGIVENLSIDRFYTELVRGGIRQGS